MGFNEKYAILRQLCAAGILYEACPRWNGATGSIWVFKLNPNRETKELPESLRREYSLNGEITV